MFSPLEAADTIRNYMENFFCARNVRGRTLFKFMTNARTGRCERLTDDAGGAAR
jgi:hypothetical protein